MDIYKRMEEHLAHLHKLGYKVAFLALQGSQNYGLDVYSEEYQSDVDTKAAIVPSLEDIIYNRPPVSTTLVLENNEHIDVKDIRLMGDMFVKQNISYLELLFSRFIIFGEGFDDENNELFNLADRLAVANPPAFYNAVRGMALEKQKALKHPYPATAAKIEKFGYDPKQLHHIVRLCHVVMRLEHEPLRECFMVNENIRQSLLDMKVKGLGSVEEVEEVVVRAIEYLTDKARAANTKKVDNEALAKVRELCGKYLEKSIIDEVRNRIEQ